jgi:hypothetical protein
MIKCFNEKCGKEIDPEWDTDCLVISVDGDFVCSKKCFEEYKRQKDNFYENIAPDEKRCYNWLLGREPYNVT